MKPKFSDKAIVRQRQIGDRLRALRENRRFSLERLGERLDPPVAKNTVRRWEIGACGIRIDYLEQLAKIFRIRPGDLLGYNDDSRRTF